MPIEQEERLKPVLHDEEPSEELLEWARKFINEDPDIKDQAISELRDMIYEKGECTPDRMDDGYLLRFLRARHFDVKKTHRLLVNYYDYRDSNPEYFKDADVFRVRALAKESLFSIPPYTEQSGRRMLILRIAAWDPSKFTLKECIQLVGAVLSVSILEPGVQIKGGILIVDLSDIPLSFAWYMTPRLASDMVNLAGLSFPVRLEAIHFVFSSWIFDTAWTMIKPLLPSFIKERVYFHGDDFESLHSHIEPKYLPKRYGGIHLDYTMDIWVDDIILKNKKAYNEFLELGYDISVLLKDKDEEILNTVIEEITKL